MSIILAVYLSYLRVLCVTVRSVSGWGAVLPAMVVPCHYCSDWHHHRSHRCWYSLCHRQETSTQCEKYVL